jgi:hypothetical protein
MALCLFGLPTKVSISFPLAKRTATHTFTKKKKIGKVKIIFFFYLKIKKKICRAAENFIQTPIFH